MLQKPIPHSKKIGVIGLGILLILGVFLLPMARGGVEKAPEEIAESKAEVAKDADEISEIAASNAEKAKNAAEIEVMKADIESLQKIIQMKLDELLKKETELKLMQHALNAKMHALGLAETTPYSTGVALAAVAPSEADPYSEQPLTKQPSGGMMMAPVPGSSSVPPPGKRPSGGMMMAAVASPKEPSSKPSGVGSSSAVSRGKRPSGGMMMGAAMPGELGVEPDSVLGEDALPENISDEVRKELLRILPGLLREMLPKLLKEAQSRTVENPSLIEQF